MLSNSQKQLSAVQQPAHQKSGLFQQSLLPKDPFNEQILLLLPTLLALPEKNSRYASHYAAEVRQKFKAVKKPVGSLGPAQASQAAPAEFVRKGEGQFKFKIISKHADGEQVVKKAPLPKSAPVTIAHISKDYLNMNKASSGTTGLVKPIVPTISYKAKPDYGRTPAYLSKRISDQKMTAEVSAKDERDRVERETLLQRGIVQLPEEERLSLMNGLRMNWERLNSEYMRLSLTVDTLPKINRKVNLEKQLKGLEEQMTKLSHYKIMINFRN